MPLQDPRTNFIFNPYDSAFHYNPYPTFDYLRTSDPVHRTIFDTWIVTSYKLADFILKSPVFETDNLPLRLRLKAQNYTIESFGRLADIIENWLFFLNPPKHTSARKILSPSLTIDAVAALRPCVNDIVEKCLDKTCQTNSFDIISDLATPLSSLTITRLLGFDESDASILRDCCQDTFLIFDQPASLDVYEKQSHALQELVSFLRQRILERRQLAGQGLLDHLLQLQQNDGGLTDEEIISTCILLAATSQESVKGLLGNSCLALSKNPECIAMLSARPELLDNALNELLRYDCPIQYIARRATQEIKLADKTIREGEYVVVYLGAANRDPEAFPDPNQLNFQRTKQNLAFGGGVHYCVGAHLAKLELEACIASLVNRFSSFRLETDNLEYAPSRIARRLESLPLSFISSACGHGLQAKESFRRD